MGRRKTLIFDIETHESNLLWSMPPEEFVRLIGFKVAGRDKVYLTTELDDLRDAITAADFIIGHNIHTFDLPAVFGVKSDVPLRLAMDRKV